MFSTKRNPVATDFSMEKVGRYFNAIQKVEKGMRYVAGAVFLLTGIYFALIFTKVI